MRSFVGSKDGVTAIAAPAAQTTISIKQGELHELRVDGALLVFFRVSAVVNPTGSTGFRVLIMGGKRL